jgi:hypothetical protein
MKDELLELCRKVKLAQADCDNRIAEMECLVFNYRPDNKTAFNKLCEIGAAWEKLTRYWHHLNTFKANLRQAVKQAKNEN